MLSSNIHQCDCCNWTSYSQVRHRLRTCGVGCSCAAEAGPNGVGGEQRVFEPKGNAITITKQDSGTAIINPLLAAFNAIALMPTNPWSHL